MMNLNVTHLQVKYNQQVVGYLRAIDNKIYFQYDNSWVNEGFSISPFSLPLSSKVYTSNSLHFDGLFGVFRDSLPDGWGELIVRRMLFIKGINYEKLSPLTKLSLVRSEVLGGLTYEPEQILEEKSSKTDLDQLSREITKLLSNQASTEDIEDLCHYGASSGGTRPKAYIDYENEPWIVKFPSMYDPKNIGELEYHANELAKATGIKIATTHLFSSKISSGFFGSKRFDRDEAGNHIHMISLSSLLETSHQIPNLDYKHYLQVIQNICVNQEDMYEGYRRMCFNIFYGNKDDHGKNFAFLYDETVQGYVLSPAYDLTKTETKLEHEMTVLGNGNPTKKDLLALAKEMKLSILKCNQIIEQVENVLRDGL